MRFGEANAYSPRPLWEVFDPKSWKANFQDGAFFKDKIVVLGASSQIAHDVFDTPINPETPGPVFHLYTLAAAMDHEFLRDTPIRIGFILVLIGGATAWTLVAFLRRPFLTFATLLLIAAAYLGLARIFYDRVGLLLMVVPPMSAFLASGLSGLGFEYALERLETSGESPALRTTSAPRSRGLSRAPRPSSPSAWRSPSSASGGCAGRGRV